MKRKNNSYISNIEPLSKKLKINNFFDYINPYIIDIKNYKVILNFVN